MSAECLDNLDEGCHGDALRLLCRFLLQNHLGLYLAEPLKEIQRRLYMSPQEASGGWRADGNCTKPSTDEAGCLRPRKQIVEISLNDSLMYVCVCVMAGTGVDGWQPGIWG